ncbi:MAG TPA: hypothetical protein DCL73_05285 [Treponema sp.]|nr:hypothetical protein [Treponema sp.]
MWLSEAMITNNCFNSTGPNIGMELSAQYNMGKCYILDIDLLVTHTLRTEKTVFLFQQRKRESFEPTRDRFSYTEREENITR